MNRRLTAIVEREGAGYVALCPDVDVASQGDSVEEARANLEEALTLFFETASPEETARRAKREFYVTDLEIAVCQTETALRPGRVPHAVTPGTGAGARSGGRDRGGGP